MRPIEPRQHGDAVRGDAHHREDGVRTADHYSRLPETNNHPGIQSATAHLVWLPTGLAIGTTRNYSPQLDFPYSGSILNQWGWEEPRPPGSL